LGEKWPVKVVCDSDFHVNRRVLLHAANMRHETDGFTSPPKEYMLCAAGRIMSMKNSSDTIGNRSRGLSVCSAVPQQLRHRVIPRTDSILT
jgi:hypothetical protein